MVSNFSVNSTTRDLKPVRFQVSAQPLPFQRIPKNGWNIVLSSFSK